MEEAVEAAKNAYSTWSKTSILSRQQIMFKYQALIKANMKRLAENIVTEQGKTTIDAEGDVLRGLRKYEICEISSGCDLSFLQICIFSEYFKMHFLAIVSFGSLNIPVSNYSFLTGQSFSSASITFLIEPNGKNLLS